MHLKDLLFQSQHLWERRHDLLTFALVSSLVFVPLWFNCVTPDCHHLVDCVNGNYLHLCSIFWSVIKSQQVKLVLCEDCWACVVLSVCVVARGILIKWVQLWFVESHSRFMSSLRRDSINMQLSLENVLVSLRNNSLSNGSLVYHREVVINLTRSSQ